MKHGTCMYMSSCDVRQGIQVSFGSNVNHSGSSLLQDLWRLNICKQPEENSLSVFAFWLHPQLYSWPSWACCTHNCLSIFLWVLLGQWQRRQNHTEPLLARVMPWMAHSHRTTSPCFSFNYWLSRILLKSPVKIIDPRVKSFCSNHVLLNLGIRWRLWSLWKQFRDQQ